MKKFNELYNNVIKECINTETVKKIIKESIEEEYFNSFPNELQKVVKNLKEDYDSASFNDDLYESQKIEDSIFEKIEEMFEDDPIMLVKVQRYVTGTTPGQKEEIEKLKNVLIKNGQEDKINEFEELLKK